MPYIYKKKKKPRENQNYLSRADIMSSCQVWVVRKAPQLAIYYTKHQTSKFLNSNAVTFKQLQHKIVHRILQLKQYQPHNFDHNVLNWSSDTQQVVNRQIGTCSSIKSRINVFVNLHTKASKVICYALNQVDCRLNVKKKSKILLVLCVLVQHCRSGKY